MSRLICSALALVVVGCAPARQIDLCARDPGVASAIAGGRFRLTVRDATGRPLHEGDVRADAPASAALGSGGAVVDVEGLAGGGDLVAAGRAGLGDQETCVCVRRVVWRGFATWQDDGGTYHDGPAVEFYVGADAGPRILQAAPVTLDRASVLAGDTLTATVAWTNRAGVPLDVGGVALVAAPPDAARTSAAAATFATQPATTIAPGQSLTLTGTRDFSSADAAGTWRVWGRLVDALGGVHEGPAVELAVGAAPTDAIVPLAPVALDKASILAGDTLVAHARYGNATAQSASLQRVVITARRPGATNAGGPFDDFSPVAGAQSLAPGAAIDVMATRDFATTDDPCAQVECTVSGGQCRFTVDGMAAP